MLTIRSHVLMDIPYLFQGELISNLTPFTMVTILTRISILGSQHQSRKLKIKILSLKN